MAEEQNTKSAQQSTGANNPGNSKLLAYQNQDISAETQEMLNKPTQHGEELNEKDVAFLTMLMEKVDSGEINLYRPSTLLNSSVYDHLDEKTKGKADFDALNLLGAIREIRKLWTSGQRNTYQIENLTHRIRVTKERLEEVGGDIYII